MTPALFHLLLLCVVASVTILMGTTMIALTLVLKQRKASVVSMHKKNKYKQQQQQQQQQPLPSTTMSTTQQQQKQHYSMSTITTTKMIRYRYAPSGNSPRTVADAHLNLALQYTTALPPFLSTNTDENNQLPHDLSHDMEHAYIQYQKWYKRTAKRQQQRLLSKSTTNKSNTAFYLVRAVIKRLLLIPSMLQQLTNTAITSTTMIFSSATTSLDHNNSKTNSKKKKKKKSRRRSITTTSSSSLFASKNDSDALWHLQKSADLGNPYAQYWMGNVLASGIYSSIPSSNDQEHNGILTTDDFGNGGDNSQLARAIILWHFASIQGIQEAQMALGYRYYSAFNAATGSTTTTSNKETKASDSSFGVVGDCATALAYYEEAANSAMDDMELLSDLKGKVRPAFDGHRLAEIHMHGASSALAHYNKPDEHSEALEYLRIRATTHSESAFSLAQLHHYGHRGVEQNMAQALKYYEIAANAAAVNEYNEYIQASYNPFEDKTTNDDNPFKTNHPEAAGLAAKFYLLGIGRKPNYKKAWKYMQMGAPGGLKTCSQDEEISRRICDAEALNCFGLAYLLGLPGIIEPDAKRAARYFTLSKDYGSSDGQYHLAMMRLGWMNTEEQQFGLGNMDPNFSTDDRRMSAFINHIKASVEASDPSRRGKQPSKADYSLSFNDLIRAANKGHIQATHKVGIMYSRGIGVQPHCPSAVKFLRQVAEQSPAMGQRLRRAHKSYREGKADVAVWNYLVVAEAGIELAQSNAAWLMERGHCLGLDKLSCANASVRLWKAASKQGNSEASIRVGDFHYYGRLFPNDRHKGSFDWPFLLIYITHPSQLVQLFRSKMFVVVRMMLRKMKDLRWMVKRLTYSNNGLPLKESTLEPQKSCDDDSDATCSSSTASSPLKKKPDEPQVAIENAKKKSDNNFKLAAQYYRKAANTNSGRAHFNLGFMYEWGLGLDQDFPLAKRHYDLAVTHHREAELAVSIALWFMHLHERCVGIRNTWQSHKGKLSSTWVRSRIEDFVFSSNSVTLSEIDLRKREILKRHIFSLDMALVVILTLWMVMLIHRLFWKAQK